MSDKRILTRFLPTYLQVQLFLRILGDTRYTLFFEMLKSIFSQKGTPQNTANWKEPEEWIPQRLTGEEKSLALRIWRESDHVVNPRYTDGISTLIKYHKLAVNTEDVFALTEVGRSFLRSDKEILAKIDKYEGMLSILADVSTSGPCKRNVLFDGFKAFCVANSNAESDSFVSSLLAYRLKNLLQRELLEKNGQNYQVTNRGLDWLELQNEYMNAVQPNQAANSQDNKKLDESYVAIARLAKQNAQVVRKQLAQYLSTMDPFRFEYLTKCLLEEMGYEDVEVTTPTNDKGVDVVGNIELGISRVREVVQVKRQKGNIGLPILHQLRGSLPFFRAMRGSIITTGGFTKQAQDAAFVPGAAPITLIDGDTLLSLLIEHNIGIRHREIRILQFDLEHLNQIESDTDSDALSV